ncbi:MAG: thioredoxin-dependent thiol peroxidase [Muribaculaceae bacterium]|nr:thioredoxin-dependent thiol peroxidase [Muribaculaceae bacterium]
MKPGDTIPAILGTDQNGHLHQASDYAGKKLIIYFYPKDNTPGCTAEACSLSDGYSMLKRAGYALLGVSKDSATSHVKFAEKYNLPFPLIADTDHTLQEAFGVWREKKMAGRTYMGTVRTTFIIDEQGCITHVIEKVNTKDHARQILEFVKQ